MAAQIDQATAKRIRELVQKNNLTFHEVARAVGVSRATPWNWAKGSHAVSLENIKKLAKFFDCDPCYLAFGVIPPNRAALPESNSSRALNSVEIPEYKFEDTAAATVAGRWFLGRRFISNLLDGTESELFLFENFNRFENTLAPGDFVIVRSQSTPPREITDGTYLIFRPHTSAVVDLKLGYDSEPKYLLTYPNTESPVSVSPKDVVILGKVVGKIRKILFSL